MTTTNGVGATQTTDDQSFVSVWITQHGKYGEYVCTVLEVFKQLLPAIPTSTATSTMLVPWVQCATQSCTSTVGVVTEVCVKWPRLSPTLTFSAQRAVGLRGLA